MHPHLLYGISIWGNTHNKLLNRLATLQNKAVKIIAGAQFPMARHTILRTTAHSEVK